MFPELAQGGWAFEIRDCQTGNVSAVRAILEVCPEAAQWSDQSIAATLQTNPRFQLVSIRHNEVTGFISGRRATDEGEILNLAVKPQCRRQGEGQALVNALLAKFMQKGVARVFLEVRESNRSAIAFYHMLGFRQVGRRQDYYQQPDEAALVLARLVSSPSPDVG